MVKNRLRILENKMATLEERFQDALGRWKENCRRNSFHSSPRPYLDCDSYREIVSIGVSCLPLIRDQLHQEIETEKRYDNELKRLKIKVFGTDQVELFGDNYKKMCKDKEYQKYQKGYGSEIIGDDFRIRVAEEGPVKSIGCFVAIDVMGVMQFTLKWLDDNTCKYMSSHI